MSKNEKGFYLFFDWIERLKELPAEDAIKIVYAIADYYKNDINPVEQFEGILKTIAGLMFDQIKRGELRTEEQRQKAFKRWQKENGNAEHIQSNAEHIPTDATYNNITNDNITNNDINNNNNNIVCSSACAQEEQQNVESFPHVEMEIMRYFAKEHFESNAEDFIAYNKARNWKGFGGEDVREDYSRYADRWEEEHLRRIGFKT